MLATLSASLLLSTFSHPSEPPTDLRETLIEVREGINGGIIGPILRRRVLVHWDANHDGFRAIEGPTPARARDVSEPEMRALVDRLVELRVLDLSCGEPESWTSDAYRRDTSLRFVHDGRSWQNGAPGGCVHASLVDWPTIGEERRFELALEAIDDVLRPDALEPDPGASWNHLAASSGVMQLLPAVRRFLEARSLADRVDLNVAMLAPGSAKEDALLWISPASGRSRFGIVELSVDRSSGLAEVTAARFDEPRRGARRVGNSTPRRPRTSTELVCKWVQIGLSGEQAALSWGEPDEVVVAEDAELRTYREAGVEVQLVLRADEVAAIELARGPDVVETPLPAAPWEVRAREHGRSEPLDPTAGSGEFLVTRPLMSFQSCFERGTRVLTRRGDAFHSEDGSITLRELDALRSALLASRDSDLRLDALESDPCPLLAAFGISEESFREHESEVVRTLVGPGPRRISDLPPAARELLRYDRVSAELVKHLLPYRRGSGGEQRVIDLPGDPPITVTTLGDSPFVFPLRVDAGGEGWVTADPALVPQLAAVYPPWAARKMVEAADARPETVWSDGMLWNWAVGPVREATASWGPEQAPADALGDELRIVEWNTEWGPGGLQLTSVLAEVTRQRERVRSLELPWPRTKGAALATLDLARSAVRARPWIEAWCKTGSYRFVEARLLSPGEADAEWEPQGFPGTAQLELRFVTRHPDASASSVSGSAWIGRDDDQTLVRWLYWCTQVHRTGDDCRVHSASMDGVRFLPEPPFAIREGIYRH